MSGSWPSKTPLIRNNKNTLSLPTGLYRKRDWAWNDGTGGGAKWGEKVTQEVYKAEESLATSERGTGDIYIYAIQARAAKLAYAQLKAYKSHVSA